MTRRRRPSILGEAGGEILTAAALQGAIFAVIRAAVERATAASAEKLAGAQPGAEVKRQQDE
jgi:uncharacterized protein DUF4235